MIRNRTNVGKTQPSQLLTGQSQFCTKYAIFLLQKLSFQFMLLYRMYFPLFVEYNSHNIFLSFDGLKSFSRKWYFYDDLPHIKFANPPRFESSRILNLIPISSKYKLRAKSSGERQCELFLSCFLFPCVGRNDVRQMRLFY